MQPVVIVWMTSSRLFISKPWSILYEEIKDKYNIITLSPLNSAELNSAELNSAILAKIALFNSALLRQITQSHYLIPHTIASNRSIAPFNSAQMIRWRPLIALFGFVLFYSALFYGIKIIYKKRNLYIYYTDLYVQRVPCSGPILVYFYFDMDKLHSGRYPC